MAGFGRLHFIRKAAMDPSEFQEVLRQSMHVDDTVNDVFSLVPQLLAVFDEPNTGDRSQRAATMTDRLLELLDGVLGREFAAHLEDDPEFHLLQDRFWMVRDYFVDLRHDVQEQEQRQE